MMLFPAEFCPPLADPLGGYQSCRDWGAGGQFKVCEIACRDGLRFSQPVPPFYTCGAEGFWRPTNHPSLPLVYPACSRKLNNIYHVICHQTVIFYWVPTHILLITTKMLWNSPVISQLQIQHSESSRYRCYSQARFSATTLAKPC